MPPPSLQRGAPQLATWLTTQHEVSSRDKLLAEKDKTLAETSKALAEAHRTIAETRLADATTQKALLDVRVAQFQVQDRLGSENEKYRVAQSALADAIDRMTLDIGQHVDASTSRNAVIALLTNDVIDSFSGYLDKARLAYRDESSAVVASFVNSEIFSFLREVRDFVEVVNEAAVLESCPLSSQPLQLTSASLGHIDRCLLDLLPLVPVEQRLRLRDEAIGESLFDFLPGTSSAVLVALVDAEPSTT